MKTVFLTMAAAFCFIASASAQNEVPGQPNTRNVTTDENVHAPVRMDRQSGTETQQEQYDATDPQHKPEPGTMSDPAHHGHNHGVKEGEKKPLPHTNDPAPKPKSSVNMNRKPAGK